MGSLHRFVIAVLAVASAVIVQLVPTPTAEANPVKLKNVHFEVELGQVVTETFLYENRLDVAVQINGWSFFTPEGIGGFPSVGGACMTLRANRVPLEPGQACDVTVSFVPAYEGNFDGEFCLEQSMYPLPCGDIRGHVRPPEGADGP
jgi:hypothetical protein